MALIDLLQFPHFIIMLIGIIHMTISILLVILHKPKNWSVLHKIFALTGVELAVIGLLILSGLILEIPHGILGLIVAIILLAELIVGFVAVKMKKREVRLSHIWIGRLIYITLLVALFLGIIYFL
jgi:hypothetical protein